MQARLRDLQGNRKGLWQKIKDFFKGWLDRVRKMLQQDTGFTKKELQIWDRLSDEIQKRLATMWGEGAADMARNLDLTEGVKLSEVQTTENAATEGGEGQLAEREEKTDHVTAGMTDEQREDVLRRKERFTSALYEGQADKHILEQRENLQSRKTELVRAALKSAAEQLGLPREVFNADMEMDLEVSFATMRESASKKINDPSMLVKLIPVLKDAVQNAVGIEVHDNRYFADTSTLYFATLLGGYTEGDYFIPVRFGAKVDRSGKNTLYVLICDEKIKKAEVDIAPGRSKSGQRTTRSASEISITRLAPLVKHVDIVKYLPDGLLTEDQKKIKWKAIADTAVYTNDKNNRRYLKYLEKGNLRDADRMVKTAAKAAGYTIDAYHGTRYSFNGFNQSANKKSRGK